MPTMDGFETAALIRKRPASEHTPIIFVTSIGNSPNQMYQGYSLGAVDYILTPIVPEVLRAKVSVFVDLWRKTEHIKQQAERLREVEEAEHRRQLAEAEDRVEAQTKRATGSSRSSSTCSALAISTGTCCRRIRRGKK